MSDTKKPAKNFTLNDQKAIERHVMKKLLQSDGTLTYKNFLFLERLVECELLAEINDLIIKKKTSEEKVFFSNTTYKREKLYNENDTQFNLLSILPNEIFKL